METEKIKVVITGSTGMVGGGVLAECLNSPWVKSVLAVNRRSLGWTHPKLKEILQGNLFDLAEIEANLKNQTACYFCLGRSSAGMSKKEYERLTYDLTLHWANTLLRLNPKITFCFITGAGTDSREKSLFHWARVKGQTENALLSLPFSSAYMFRPSLIEPNKAQYEKLKGANRFYRYLRPFFPLLRPFPSFYTSVENLGKAMIATSITGYSKSILAAKDIHQLGHSFTKHSPEQNL